MENLVDIVKAKRELYESVVDAFQPNFIDGDDYDSALANIKTYILKLIETIKAFPPRISVGRSHSIAQNELEIYLNKYKADLNEFLLLHGLNKLINIEHEYGYWDSEEYPDIFWIYLMFTS